jgi:aflatoxin B1 aldehyde reductase
MADREKIEIVLGTANFGYDNNWWGESDAHILEAFSLLRQYGHNKLDSAQQYAGSEAKLGSLGAGTQYGLSIDTKWLGGWAREENANKKEAIVTTAERSLSKLGVANVDVFYIHAPIYDTPLKDTLSGVNAVFEAGMFRRFGLSNYPPEDVQKVYDVCKANNFVLPSVYQGSYSAISRGQEYRILPLLRKLGIAFYAYSPIAGGFLTKTREQIQSNITRFSPDQMYGLYHKMYVKHAFLEGLDEWTRIADEEGVSKTELAYRWIVFNSGLRSEHGDAVVIGASNSTQLEQTLMACAKGPLSEQAARRIDGVWKTVKHEAYIDNYQAVFGAKGSE